MSSLVVMPPANKGGDTVTDVLAKATAYAANATRIKLLMRIVEYGYKLLEAQE